MKSVQFSVIINAPASEVWRHTTSLESYTRWASAFAEGSHFRGSWEQGSRIWFLSPSGDGMVSEIAESRASAFISIRHLGFLVDGVEDTTSEAVKAWAPAYENYTFLTVADGTRMTVDLDVDDEWEAHLSEMWPKALALLKAVSESDGREVRTVPREDVGRQEVS